MTDKELIKEIEGVIGDGAKAIVENVIKPCITELVEIDKPLLGFVIGRHLKAEPVAAKDFFRDSLVRDISKANPIKLTENK